MSSRRGAREYLAAGSVALAGGALAHLLPGVVAWRGARCKLLPELSGVGDARHVALTFDDGPHPASTPQILDLLDSLGWRATFFLLGSQGRRFPDLVVDLVARGHEIGVHGDTHTSHLRRPVSWTVRDVMRAKRTLGDISGRPIRWFRPPYGALSASSLVAARAAGLQTVLWTTWGMDWKPGACGQSVAGNVLRTQVPGATVLLHDSDVTSAPGSWRATLDALPILSAAWDRAGLRVGPLAEHGVGGSGAS